METTKRLMFRPIRWDRWWRAALLALATGEVAAMGGCNFGSLPIKGFPGIGKHPPPDQFVSVPGIPPVLAAWGMMFVILILALIFLLILLVFVHIYVGSVFRFILFDAVTAARFKLLEGWRRRHRPGTRFFVFQIVFMILMLAGLGLICSPFIAWAAAAGMFAAPAGDWHPNLATVVSMIFLLLPILVLYSLTTGLIALGAKDFCVPVMALENVGIMAALRVVMARVRREKSNFAMYVIMKIVLAIAVGIAASIAIFLVSLIIIIPVAIAGLMMPHMSVPPATNILFWATVISAGMVLLVVLIFLVGLVSGPAAIFFEAYALEFFGDRYAPLGSLLHPPPPPLQVTQADLHEGGLDPQAL